ncbi:unnamed protein product [Sphagnum tenellum]
MEGRLLAWSLQVLGHFEGRLGSFLGEYSDRAEVRRGDGESLVSGGLDAPVGSLTREQPMCVKAFPSLRPPIPSGTPLVLRIYGLPKRGRLKVLAALIGSALVRPGLTFSQAPIMLFHIKQWILLSLGAVKRESMSRVLGPLPWMGSLIWSALCLISSFQGSPPRASPLISNLANRASDCVFGSMIPRSPLGGRERQRVPFDFGACGCVLTTPDEVSDNSPDLGAHPWVGVPTRS